MKKDHPILQIKVSLSGLRPPVWRRLLVDESMTFEKLHIVIQVAMGWEFAHLYQFKVGKFFITELSPEDGFDVFDQEKYFPANEVHLVHFGFKPGDKFRYIYDFGDDWEHVIEVEKRLPRDPSMHYPVCVAGKRNCPPEDAGGVWGYQAKLDILKDPTHPDYEFVAEWMGEDFDPEYFDLEETNEALREFDLE